MLRVASAYGRIMKKLEPNLSSIFLEIRSSMDIEKINNHPFFRGSSPQEFEVVMATVLEAFARDLLEIEEIDLEYPPLHEDHFREGWIKNWMDEYFGIN